MPEPRQHTEHRGPLESILRHIPGFRGYLEKEYRRDSDSLQRSWLADRLDQSKRSLETVGSILANAGHLELLTQYDHLRAKIDRVIARIRGGWQGYSGVFDLVRVNETLLDRVYEHDMGLMGHVEDLASSIERLAGAPERGPVQTAAPPDLPPHDLTGTPASPDPAAPISATPVATEAGPPDPATMLPRLNQILDEIDRGVDQRAELLKGLE